MSQQRNRFRYGLWKLLVASVCCIVFIACSSWFVIKLQRAKRQQQAVAMVKKRGGTITYDYEVHGNCVSNVSPYGEITISEVLPDGPLWLRRWIGDDFFNIVVEASVTSDAAIEQLKELEQLQEIVLCCSITDAGLKHIEGMSRLQIIRIQDAEITDTGLAYLQGLSELKSLTLIRCNNVKLKHCEMLKQLHILELVECPSVTDASMEHLSKLQQLQVLIICGTSVNDAGLKYLDGLRQLYTLGLAEKNISNVGIEYLKGLNQLRTLILLGSKVTDAGLECLKGLNQLQRLILSGTQVTDIGLMHLYGLAQLQELDVQRTMVTDDGVRKLQQALPHCTIFYNGNPRRGELKW